MQFQEEFGVATLLDLFQNVSSIYSVIFINVLLFVCSIYLLYIRYTCGIRRKAMQLTEFKGEFKSYILIKRWTNEARKFMADYPLCNHSSILLNHIVGKARLEIEIREFSASTESEVILNAILETYSLDDEPSWRLFYNRIQFDGESIYDLASSLWMMFKNCESESGLHYKSDQRECILIEGLCKALRDNDIAIEIYRIYQLNPKNSFWDLRNMAMKLEKQRVTQSSHANKPFLSFTAKPQEIVYTIHPRNTDTPIPASRSKCILNRVSDIGVPDSISVDSYIPIPAPRYNAGIISQPLSVLPIPRARTTNRYNTNQTPVASPFNHTKDTVYNSQARMRIKGACYNCGNKNHYANTCPLPKHSRSGNDLLLQSQRAD